MRRDHYREPSVFAHAVQAEFPGNPMKRRAPLVYLPNDRPSADRLHQRGGGFEGCPPSSSPPTRPLGRCGPYGPRGTGRSCHQCGWNPHGVQRAAAARRVRPVRPKIGPRARCGSRRSGPCSRRGPHADLRSKWDVGLFLKQPLGLLGHSSHTIRWHWSHRASHPR